MKKVLSLLLAFVFLQVETWALSGGPDYGGNQASLVGTYAGVLTGIRSTVTPTGSTIEINPSANALGIFVIGVPQTDAARGTIALFALGIFYQGGILGVADPNEKTLTGIAQAVHIFSSFQDDDSFSFTYDSRCDGTVKADIETRGAGLGSTLKGVAEFTVANFDFNTFEFPTAGSIDFKVDGFQQSTQVVIPDPTSTAGILSGT